MNLNINQIRNFLAVTSSSPEIKENEDCMKLHECLEANKDEYQCTEEFGNFKNQIDSKTGIYDFILNRFSLSEVSVDPLVEGEIIPAAGALVAIVRKHNIPLSEGEASWIDNMEEPLKGATTACCSSKAGLLREARVCYLDLVDNCDSNWLFVKHIKKALSIESITFKAENEILKTV